jgi:hypothetical protein
MESTDTGILLNAHNIKLQREYFKQMLKLRGIMVIHRAPKSVSKTYDGHGELDTLYEAPVQTACIFEEHPNQWTMRKLGWDSVLQEANSLIHVPYDLDGVQAGSLFIIPSGLDSTTGRVFKVIRMSNIAVYPSEIVCEIGPVFNSTFEPVNLHDFTSTNFNLLAQEDNEDDPTAPVTESDTTNG